jgi:hypothetical protein
VPCADAHRGQDHSLPEDPLAIASVRFYSFFSRELNQMFGRLNHKSTKIIEFVLVNS